MWFSETVKWNSYPKIVEAVSAKRLVVVVGNGLSRLSGSPSWQELLTSPAVEEALHSQNVDPATELRHGTSPLELAELIKGTAAWGDVVQRIKTWNDKAKPSIVHKLLYRVLEPQTVYTFNFDTLLSIERRQATPLHGKPGDPSTWVIYASAYERAFNDTVNTLLRAIAEGKATLFLGYGHSYDDYDVMAALSPKRHQRAGIFPGTLFTLVASHDAEPMLRARLKRLGIQAVEYSLSANAPPTSRILALGQAILDLAYQSLPEHTVKQRAGSLLDELQTLADNQQCPNQGRSIIIGLAAINRIAKPHGRYPSGVRESILTAEHHEPGGPGVIVAKILSKLGHPASLVSKIVNDAEGVAVRRFLTETDEGESPLDLDYLEESPQWKDPTFHTWTSYVLLNPQEKRGQRTFLDRKTDLDKLKISQPITEKIQRAIEEYKPSYIYFDKFFGDTVNDLLRSTVHPLPKETCTIYETGSDGDRRNPQGSYYLENNIIHQRVNIVTASFRFARDYLAKERGNLSKSTWQSLGGGQDLAANDEANIIASKIVNNSALRSELVFAIRKGAKNWLRTTAPRVVFVTLHEHGSMWSLVDKDEAGLVEADPSDSYNNFSAGDVFRGVLLSGMAESHNRGYSIDAPAFLPKLCELANAGARLKVESPSLTAILNPLGDLFLEWKERVFRAHP